MRHTKPHPRRVLVTRTLTIAAWTVLALAGAVPAAYAVGLPFVDLPTAGSVASDAMDSASRAIVNLVASAVGSLTNEIIKASDTLAAPEVGSSNAWFTASYKRTMGVSLYLMAIASLIAITAAGVRGKVGDIAQVIFVGIPGSVLAMMLATLGVQLSLSLTDAMTAYTFRSSVSDIQTFLHDIGTVFTSTSGAAEPTAQLAPGLVLIIGLLLIIAQLVILAVLIIRAALIYIVTLFLPLVFAMQVWPATRHMTRKALELLAVLILSKFAIFTCFALGAGATRDLLSAASAGGGPPAVQSAIVGFGVMAAAAFSPMLLMSIVPGVAGSFGAGMPGGTAGTGALAVKSPTQIMRSTLSGVHTVRGGNHSSSSHRSSSARGSASDATAGRAPSPPGGTSGSSGSDSGGVAVEQAHTAAAAHPATAAVASGAHVLASGAQTAAHTTHQSASGAVHSAAANEASGTHNAATPSSRLDSNSGTDSGSRSGSSPGASSSSSGPHVVSERPASHGVASREESAAASASRDQQRPPHDGTPRSGDAGSRDTAGVASSPRGQQQLSLDDARATADGFASVSTRQPFTLETT